MSEVIIRVGVLGARGKMGRTVVDAVNNAPGMEVVAALDLGDSLEALLANKAEVVVDFTTPMQSWETLISSLVTVSTLWSALLVSMIRGWQH